MPLIIRYAIDAGITQADGDLSALGLAVTAFAIAALINYGASTVQEMGESAKRPKMYCSTSAGRCSRIYSGFRFLSWIGPRWAG